MSILVQEPDRILYLVRRKYRGFPYEDIYDGHGHMSASVRQALSEIKEKADAYCKELLTKSIEEIAKLYQEEQEEERQEWLDRYIAEEKQRFFHQSNAQADYTHWGKAIYWTLEEAIALSFGKDPKIVNWDKLSKMQCYPPSPFIEQYGKVRELVLRACGCNLLCDPIIPGFYIAWAKRNDISFPEELEKQVILRAGNIGDWKTAYDNLKQLHEALQVEYQAYIAEAQRIVSEKDEQLAITTNMRDVALKNSADLHLRLEQETAKQEKPLKTRERETLLKIIVSMAVDKYRYNPRAEKCGGVTRIKDAIEKAGLEISDDTIRAKLLEAEQYLSQEYLEEV